MDFIVSEFINLIKRCSNGLALEKEIWRRGIELQCQAFAQALETYDAEMARQYAGKQEVLRIDRRTVLCMFGTVTFSRRLVRREGGKPFYPLDNILGLSPYQRYSLLLLYSVTKVAAGSVYRAAAEAVNTLTPLDISHQTVGRMVRTVGDKYAQYGRGGGPSARMVVGVSASADNLQEQGTTDRDRRQETGDSTVRYIPFLQPQS